MRLYVVKAGEPIGEAGKIIGIDDPGYKPAVNIVGFVLDRPLSPSDLQTIDAETRHVANKLDERRPVIITGRGPTWLYGLLVHNMHYHRAGVAVYDPRLRAGVLVSGAPADLGRVVTLDGRVLDANIPGARDDPDAINIRHGDVGDLYLVAVEPKTRTLHPRIVRVAVAQVEGIHTDKPVGIYGPMPVWLAGALAAELAHAGKALAFYDPKLNGLVVAASHDPGIEVGSVLPLPTDAVVRLESMKPSKVINVVGRPTRDRESLVHLLGQALAKRGSVIVIDNANVSFRVIGQAQGVDVQEIADAAARAAADAAYGKFDYIVVATARPVERAAYILAFDRESVKEATAPTLYVKGVGDFKQAVEKILGGEQRATQKRSETLPA